MTYLIFINFLNQYLFPCPPVPNRQFSTQKKRGTDKPLLLMEVVRFTFGQDAVITAHAMRELLCSLCPRSFSHFHQQDEHNASLVSMYGLATSTKPIANI